MHPRLVEANIIFLEPGENWEDVCREMGREWFLSDLVVSADGTILRSRWPRIFTPESHKKLDKTE